MKLWWGCALCVETGWCDDGWDFGQQYMAHFAEKHSPMCFVQASENAIMVAAGTDAPTPARPDRVLLAGRRAAVAEGTQAAPVCTTPRVPDVSE